MDLIPRCVRITSMLVITNDFLVFKEMNSRIVRTVPSTRGSSYLGVKDRDLPESFILGIPNYFFTKRFKVLKERVTDATPS